MAHRAVEIANEILSQPNALGRLTQMQLQKLAYIAEGWTLGLTGEDLISDNFEAWDFGPVAPDLYNHTKYFGRNPINRLLRHNDNDPAAFFGLSSRVSEPYRPFLSGTEKGIISRVYNRYGKLDGVELSRLTHQPGTPWYIARRKRKNAIINRDDIRAHYEELAHAG